MIKQQKQSNIHTLEKYLKTRIFGQDHIIKNVLETLSISFAGLHDENKPLASFLFTGPTGVGKTEFAIELAKALNMKFVRFDMSEYADKHSIRNLTGGDAGLVGYEDGGLLTNEILKNPKSIILLDEIEKADEKVYNTFLQVLDYGTLTDTQGNKAKFNESIIIMTSNLGANESNGIGFGNTNINREKAVINFLTPEFRNRIDKILEFQPMTLKTAKDVAFKFLDDFRSMLKMKNIELKISNNAISYLTQIGFQSQMGARSVKRAIDTRFKATISKTILNSNKPLKLVSIDYLDNEFLFEYEFNDMDLFTQIDQLEKAYFRDVTKAQEYAKANRGVYITKAIDGIGFVAKEIKQNSLF
jgi:ATP-dependent Clp protease ATP-binding subunit ClpA